MIACCIDFDYFAAIFYLLGAECGIIAIVYCTIVGCDPIYAYHRMICNGDFVCCDQETS